MISYTLLISTAIVSLAVKSTDAFSTSCAAPVHRRSLLSSTAIEATLDGIAYESSQTYQESISTEYVMLALYHDDSVEHSDGHILACILEVTGKDAADTYDAIYHSKGISKVAEIDEFPQEEGVRCYEQLKTMGIPVQLC